MNMSHLSFYRRFINQESATGLFILIDEANMSTDYEQFFHQSVIFTK